MNRSVDLIVRRFVLGSLVAGQIPNEMLEHIVFALSALNLKPEALRVLEPQSAELPENAVETLLNAGKFGAANWIATTVNRPIPTERWQSAIVECCDMEDSQLLSLALNDIRILLECSKDLELFDRLLDRLSAIGAVFDESDDYMRDPRDLVLVQRERAKKLAAYNHYVSTLRFANLRNPLADWKGENFRLKQMLIDMLDAETSAEWHGRLLDRLEALNAGYSIVDRLKHGGLKNSAGEILARFAEEGNLDRLLDLSSGSGFEVPPEVWRTAIDVAVSTASVWASSLEEASTVAEIPLPSDLWRQFGQAQISKSNFCELETLIKADDTPMWVSQALKIAQQGTSAAISEMLQQLHSRGALESRVAAAGAMRMISLGAISEGMRYAALHDVKISPESIRRSVTENKDGYRVHNHAHLHLLDDVLCHDVTPICWVPEHDFGGDLSWLDEPTAEILVTLYLPYLTYYLKLSRYALDAKNLDGIDETAKYFWRQISRVCKRIESERITDKVYRHLVEADRGRLISAAELFLEQHGASISA